MYYRDHFISTILSLIEVIQLCLTCCHSLSLLYAHLHPCPCIHDVSGQRDAAEQIAAYRLPVFQSMDTGRMWSRCAVLD